MGRQALAAGDSAELIVDGDHWQVLFTDELQEDADWAGAWLESAAQSCEVVMWRGGLALGTSRLYGDFRFCVEFAEQEPTLDLCDYDHLVETGIELRTGRVSMYGPESTGAAETFLTLPCGTFSAVYAIEDAVRIDDEFAETEPERYRLTLWSGPVLERRCLKQGRGPAPGAS
jgi:hypothetical protein